MESIIIKNRLQRVAFMVDIGKLQAAKTKEIRIFDIASDLFVRKWSTVSKDLKKYFQEEWLTKNRNWFEAFARRTPSTNNCTESFNNTIKTHTHRERLAIGEFRRILFDMVREWAVTKQSELIIIHNDRPLINLGMWTKSYNWLKSNLKMKITKSISDEIW